MTETDQQEQRLREHQRQRIERLVEGLVAADGPDLNQKHADMLWLVRELRARDAEIASLKARVAELEQEKESIYRDAEKGRFG